MKHKIASVILGVLVAITNIPVAYAQTTEQTDTSAPTLVSISPAAEATFTTGTIKISAQGVYDPSGVKSVSFEISNQVDVDANSTAYIATNTVETDWSAVLSTSDLGNTPGTYLINVIGTDALGNQGVIGSTSFALSADDASPILQSVSPQNGTTIGIDSKDFTVSANVSDTSGVKAVSFTIFNEADGENGAVSLGAVQGTDSSWSQKFSLSSFESKSGKYTIEVWAMDMLGNVSKIGSTELVVKDPTKVTDTSKAEALIQAAMSELGKTYVLGGKGATVFDCSGLVYYALKSSGNPISYMTSAQWALSSYQRVNSMSDLQRGDIICFKGHVGIYLGNGSMINASSSHGSVIISNNILTNAYWQANFLCARRLF
jgi:cell wall-associated NlpC family hydrolase